MKMIFSFVLTVLLTSCATAPPPQVVKVEVATPCIKANLVPPRPDYETAHLADVASDGAKILALARDWLISRPYERDLETIVQGCSKL